MKKLMDVNYFGTYYATRAALRGLRRQQRGHTSSCRRLPASGACRIWVRTARRSSRRSAWRSACEAEVAGCGHPRQRPLSGLERPREFIEVMSREPAADDQTFAGPRNRPSKRSPKRSLAQSSTRSRDLSHTSSRAGSSAQCDRAWLHRSDRPEIRPEAGARGRIRARSANASLNTVARSRDRDGRPQRRRPRAHRRRLGARSAARSRLQRHRPRGLRSARRSTARAARIVRARRSGRRELSGLQARRHRRVAAAARVEVRARAQGLRGHRRSVDVHRGRGAPARLHGQRDPLGSADRTSISIRSTAAATSSAASSASSIRRRSPTTACACSARFSSPRGSTSRSTTKRGRSAASMPLDDLPAERVWGEIEKLLLAPRPSDRFRARAGARCRREAVSGAKALDGCPQEPEWHPEGDVWVHTLQVIDQARHAHRRSSAPAADRDHARRGLPRPRQAGDDGVVDGRIRSHDHEEQGVAPATSLLDRLNVHSIDGYDVRRQVPGSPRSISSRACGTRKRRGRRRRVPPPRRESGSGTARAARQGRLPRPRARRLRLRGDGLVSRARAPARRRTAARRRFCSAVICSSWAEAGPARRRDSEGGLRAAAGRHGHDD